MPDYKNILFDTKDHLAYVTINRPERRNAVDPATSAELKDAFEAFKADDNLWAAVLTGAGEDAFCAGADLVAMAQSLSGGGGDAGVMNAPFGGITRGFECWKPIIAAIHGYCLAGGLEIALSCDIRIAADNSQFGLPEPKRAIIPGATGTQRLPRAVPRAFAMELLLTGDRYDAETALRFGLVSRVVPRADLKDTVDKVAASILENGPLAVRAIKESAVRGMEMKFEDGLALEAQLAGKIFRTKDALEGPTAFSQKRKPSYKGE